MAIYGVTVYSYVYSWNTFNDLKSRIVKKRINAKQQENDQKLVLLFSGLMFVSGFIVAGLNYRYKWIEIPNIIVIVSSIIFIIAYILYAEVLRENAYLSINSLWNNSSIKRSEFQPAATY